MIGYRPLMIALRDRLQDRLPSALVSVQGGDASLPYLPPPAVYRFYANHEEADYPVVMILPGEATPREQTGEWLTSVREIQVVVMHREENLERLSDALLSYEIAVVGAAEGKHAPAPAHGIAWRRTSPGELFELEGPVVLWQSWISMLFELTVYEETRLA